MHQAHIRSADAEQELDCRPAAVAPEAIIEFPDPALAGHLVAGVPAAARMVRAARAAGLTACIITAPEEWQPDAFTRAEIARLGGDMRVTCASSAAAAAGLPPLATMSAEAATVSLAGLDAAAARRRLDQWGKEILRATGKPTDGIVSRTINRPISQAVSGQLLRLRGIRPHHATWLTALLALAMSVLLLLGGPQGLLPGAILFQAASIIDGVDGEIARATFRESAAGARLDSLVDAATNLAFIAGVAINLYFQGDLTSAAAGGVGLAAFAAGLALIARRTRQRETGLTFNAVKDHFRKRPTRLMTFLTWLTMRDFFALAFAVLIAAGLAAFAMKAFLVIVCGWLVVVLRVMHRQT